MLIYWCAGPVLYTNMFYSLTVMVHVVYLHCLPVFEGCRTGEKSLGGACEASEGTWDGRCCTSFVIVRHLIFLHLFSCGLYIIRCIKLSLSIFQVGFVYNVLVIEVLRVSKAIHGFASRRFAAISITRAF